MKKKTILIAVITQSGLILRSNPLIMRMMEMAREEEMDHEIEVLN